MNVASGTGNRDIVIRNGKANTICTKVMVFGRRRKVGRKSIRLQMHAFRHVVTPSIHWFAKYREIDV